MAATSRSRPKTDAGTAHLGEILEHNHRTNTERNSSITNTLEAINPFYAACLRWTASARPMPAGTGRSTPGCPGTNTGSPVPHLTSLYHFHRAGEYGDRKWPGNCGGNLIKDLLNYFKPTGWCSTRCAAAAPPGRLRGTGHPVHGLGHPSGLRRLRPEGFSRRGDVRFHLGTPALLAA